MHGPGRGLMFQLNGVVRVVKIDPSLSPFNIFIFHGARRIHIRLFLTCFISKIMRILSLKFQLAWMRCLRAEVF